MVLGIKTSYNAAEGGNQIVEVVTQDAEENQSCPKYF